ncbi:hypothetical protein B7494_g4216 [Chlorociboria aeruginascens]|nr:hypothetical protein B7494_g4216 [Chlorociboria aeruginascens]
MNTTTAYTPLESLLLFQSLVAYGTDPQSFVRISDLLTNNPLVKDGDTYDPNRLTVDALCELYLRLLREELISEGQDGPGEGSKAASKKRKLPTIRDTQEHREKLPILVERLYARYKDYMIRAIREDERQYSLIQQQLDEINRGEWDERVLEEDIAAANKKGTSSAEAPNPEVNRRHGVEATPVVEEPTPIKVNIPPEPSQKSVPPPRKPSPSPISPLTQNRPEGLAISDVLNKQENAAPSSPGILGACPGNGSPLPQPNVHQSAGNTEPHGATPLQINAPQQWKWEHSYQIGTPHQPFPYSPSSSYPQFNTPQYPPHSPQYPPQGYPLRRSFSGPHGLQPPHPHAPSSPHNVQHPHGVLLPPPNTVHRSPSSPSMPLDALADIAGQQYRAPSSSPLTQQPGTSAPSYPPQQRPPSSNGPPQWNQHHASPYPLQQQTTNFNSQHPSFPPPQPSLVPPENRQYNSPYNASQNPRNSMPNAGLPQIRSGPSLPSTPLSRTIPRFMTGTGTRWTATPTGSTPRPYTIIDSPAMEPLSPVQRPAVPATVKKSSKTLSKKTEKSKSSKPPPKRGAQRPRAGSTPPSAVARSFRSQSVVSHVDELSVDSHPVKQEVATPQDAGDTTADEGPGRRLGTTASPRNPKRKRHEAVDPRQPSGPATHVLWTRAFPKIGQSPLDEISGHRNASTFAAPVKERDAPGYKEIILRPQDIKSIRSAIAAGNRAAAAVAPSDLTQSNVWLPISEDLIPPKGIINSAQLEKELMRMFANAVMFNGDPNRGFGLKFENKEKREEADRTGYEIDEDSIVKDTIAMFTDVDQIVNRMRTAERVREDTAEKDRPVVPPPPIANRDDNEDELAGNGDDISGGGGVAKRRRKA